MPQPHPNSLANLQPRPPWNAEQAKKMSALAHAKRYRFHPSNSAPQSPPEVPQTLQEVDSSLAFVLSKEAQKHPSHVNLKRIAKALSLLKQTGEAKVGKTPAKAIEKPIQSLTPGARPKNPPL